METIEVSTAVIVCGAKVLAAQRGRGALAGGWEFPGGKIDVGETPEQAAVREVREELGVDIALDGLFAVVDYEYDAFRLHMHCFFAHLVGGRIELREHLDVRWLDAATIDSVSWLPADIEAVRRLKRMLAS